MKKTTCWAIKLKHGKFVQHPLDMKYWEAERTMTFRTRKFAQDWLEGNPFWKGRGEVMKVTITVRGEGE